MKRSPVRFRQAAPLCFDETPNNRLILRGFFFFRRNVLGKITPNNPVFSGTDNPNLSPVFPYTFPALATLGRGNAIWLRMTFAATQCPRSSRCQAGQRYPPPCVQVHPWAPRGFYGVLKIRQTFLLHAMGARHLCLHLRALQLVFAYSSLSNPPS